jgi:hypothetical protein
LITYPSTSTGPLRWKAPAQAQSNIQFQVRPVQHVETVYHLDDASDEASYIETPYVEAQPAAPTAFTLQLDSPQNQPAAQEPRRMRTIGTPGGAARSVLSTRNSNANDANPFHDPFDDGQDAVDQFGAPGALEAADGIADDGTTVLQPEAGGDFDPDEFPPDVPELTPPGELTPPMPSIDPDDAPPLPPATLRQGPAPLLNPPGGGAAGAPMGRRRCGIYNDRDCCEDEHECLRSLDRVRSDTLRMFGRDRLDITPAYVPDARTPEEIERAEERKRQQLVQSGVRPWKRKDGRLLAEGQLVDLVENKAVIATPQGRQVEVRLHELADDELCFIAAWYNLPTECTLGNDPYLGRQFLASTMTWRASDLCHKPLYFEQVQLERYGHTAGPIAQPVISGAHFVANIALLPYTMGIHPPQECQYALGYYRPGSCAPWMVPAFPLSPRGAATAGAVYTGGVFLIP